jgi:serine/threonine-protein kinase RsbW
MTSSHRITRAAYYESLQNFREFIKQHCTGLPGIDAEILYDVQLAVDEACTNIISHGYAGLDPGSIILDLEIDPGRLTVILTDFGHSFEPSSAPAPDVNAPIEERELGGFGLFFIQQSMDEMDYQVTEDGNKMILTKYLRKRLEDQDGNRSSARNQ